MVNALGMELPHFEVEEINPDLKIEDTTYDNHHEGPAEEQEERTLEEFEIKPDKSSSEYQKLPCDDFSSEIGKEEDEPQEEVLFNTVSEYYKSEETFRKLKEMKGMQMRCGNCTFVTIKRNKMEEHKLKNKHEEILLKCSMCNFRSYSQANILKHRSITKHPIQNLPIHKCDGCDYTSHRKSDVRQHKLSSKHTLEEASYKCA